jgi:hypothetical protein
VKAETLQVPGASLYYEVRGSGPVLLMIPDGPMDADGFTGIADRLADVTKGVGFGNDEPPRPAGQTPEAAAAGARMGANLELFAGRLIPIIGN